MVSSWIQCYFLRVLNFPSKLGEPNDTVRGRLDFFRYILPVFTMTSSSHSVLRQVLQYRFHPCTPSLTPSLLMNLLPTTRLLHSRASFRIHCLDPFGRTLLASRRDPVPSPCTCCVLRRCYRPPYPHFLPLQEPPPLTCFLHSHTHPYSLPHRPSLHAPCINVSLPHVFLF